MRGVGGKDSCGSRLIDAQELYGRAKKERLAGKSQQRFTGRDRNKRCDRIRIAVVGVLHRDLAVPARANIAGLDHSDVDVTGFTAP